MEKQTEKCFFQSQGTLSMQCGLHSINNLLRRQAYTKQNMEQICYELSSDTPNPHKHIFGGDYDVNVILIALERCGFEGKWVNKKQGFDYQAFFKSFENEISIQQENNENQKKKVKSLGLLINQAIEKKFYHRLLMFSARHWIIVRKGTSKDFQICDSNKKSPEPTTKQELKQWLEAKMNTDAQIIWVVENV